MAAIRILKYGIMALAMLLAAACADESQFRVSGTIEGKPTMNLRVGYYADNAYRTMITAVREGEFEFTGHASQPSLLEIFDHEYRLLGRLYVANGQEITCHLERNNPYAITAQGSDVSREWADYLRQNSDSLRAGAASANSVIANYVLKNPSNVISTLLLVTSFDSAADPMLADSLLASIAPEARPGNLTEGYNFMLQRLVTDAALGPVSAFPYRDSRDSIMTFNPEDNPVSMLVLSDATSDRSDSIVPALKRLAHKKSGIKPGAILDLMLGDDTIVWKRAIAPDSASWRQAWAPGRTATPGVDRLGIPSVPYVIVCDSTGTQIYRGKSIGEAEKTVRSLRK